MIRVPIVYVSGVKSINMLRLTRTPQTILSIVVVVTLIGLVLTSVLPYPNLLVDALLAPAWIILWNECTKHIGKIKLSPKAWIFALIFAGAVTVVRGAADYFQQHTLSNVLLVIVLFLVVGIYMDRLFSGFHGSTDEQGPIARD